jgi:hypothetical protein
LRCQGQCPDADHVPWSAKAIAWLPIHRRPDKGHCRRRGGPGLSNCARERKSKIGSAFWQSSPCVSPSHNPPHVRRGLSFDSIGSAWISAQTIHMNHNENCISSDVAGRIYRGHSLRHRSFTLEYARIRPSGDLSRVSLSTSWRICFPRHCKSVFDGEPDVICSIGICSIGAFPLLIERTSCAMTRTSRSKSGAALNHKPAAQTDDAADQHNCQNVLRLSVR